LSKQHQELSQDSTPSASTKSPKPAKGATGGDTRQKLREDDEASDRTYPVKAIYFYQPVKWPDVAGAATALKVGKPNGLSGQNVIWCDTIFLHRGEFIVNGKQFMPKTAGCIQCYEF